VDGRYSGFGGVAVAGGVGGAEVAGSVWVVGEVPIVSGVDEVSADGAGGVAGHDGGV